MNQPRQVIVLTGATRGLGRALIEPFLASGATVLGCGRSTTHIEQLRSLYPAPHRWDAVDMASWEQVQAWAEALLAEYGPPDLLINNAARMNTPAPLWQVDPTEFTGVVNVNVLGVFHGIRAFVPAMVARNSGIIVNLSSGWGRSTSPEVAPYCATKYAVEGLTLALAQELPRTMAAIPLNPGVINTEMLQQAWAAGASAYPPPDVWAERAAPFILKLTPRENGRSLSVA